MIIVMVAQNYNITNFKILNVAYRILQAVRFCHFHRLLHYSEIIWQNTFRIILLTWHHQTLQESCMQYASY